MAPHPVEPAPDLAGAVEHEFVADTLIAGKMYEWWRHKPTQTLVLRESSLRDPAFVDRLRSIVDRTAMDSIAGVEEIAES